MAHKTYVPGLRAALEVAYQYGTRWQTKLAGTLTAEQATCLSETLTALAACIILLGPNPINP